MMITRGKRLDKMPKRSLFLSLIKRVLLLLSLSSAIQSTIADDNIDICNKYQHSLQLDEFLRMDYVVYEDEEDNEIYMKVQLVLEEEYGWENSWIGFGIHQPGSVEMVPGEAIIGIPTITETTSNNNAIEDPSSPTDTVVHNVYKYSLGGYSKRRIQKFPLLQQTLMGTEIIADNTTMTIVRFIKKLNEGEDELRIFSEKDSNDVEEANNAVNNFMWAYGDGAKLGFHKSRGSFAIQALSICSSSSGSSLNNSTAISGSDGFIELDAGKSYPELYALHGLLATIAWGVCAPIAIGSAMLRKYLSCFNGTLWFKCHYYFNLLTFIFTLASFVIAVVAHQKSTPKGKNPKHFVAFAHATVGLIIMIFLLVQVINGWFRPHPVSKSIPSSSPTPSNHDNTVITAQTTTTTDEEGDFSNKNNNKKGRRQQQGRKLRKIKQRRRSIWEYCHRIIGAALIGICWYQIHDGMTIYIERYNGNDYRTIFWSSTGGLSGFILLIYMCSSKPRSVNNTLANNNDDDDLNNGDEEEEDSTDTDDIQYYITNDNNDNANTNDVNINKNNKTIITANNNNNFYISGEITKNMEVL